jgi:hypothetical protein
MYECGKFCKLHLIFHVREVQYALIVSRQHKGFEVKDTTRVIGKLLAYFHAHKSQNIYPASNGLNKLSQSMAGVPLP